MSFFSNQINNVILIELGVILIEYLVIHAIPPNKKYTDTNQIPVFFSLICMILLVVLAFLWGLPHVPSLILPYGTLLILVSIMVLYTTFLLTAGIVLYKKEKKGLLELRIARQREFLDKLKESVWKRRAVRIPFWKRMLILLLPSFSLYYMLMLFGVSESFFANSDECLFAFSDFIFWAVMVCILLSAVTVLIGTTLFKGDTCKDFAAFLTGVNLISYVQNSVLNGKKLITGEVMVPAIKDHLLGFLNFLIWLSIIIVSVILCRKYRNFFKYLIGISGLLLCMQVVPLFVMIGNAPSDLLRASPRLKRDLDGSEQFAVSADGNATIFIMDCFSIKSLMQYLEDHEEYKTLLSDYVLFTDVDSETMHTPLSLPSLLTATEQEYTVSMLKANEACWHSRNAEYFYNTVHNLGYQVRLYTNDTIYCGGVENMEGKIDNICEFETNYTTDGFMTYLSLMKLSLYKYLPDICKPIFYVDNMYKINLYSVDESLSDDAHSHTVAFYNFEVQNSIENKMYLTSGTKLCTLMHTWGVHPAYYGHSLDEQVSKEDAIEQCLQIILTYSKKLKELGVYDDSTIIMTTDHGEARMDESAAVMMIKPPHHTGSVLENNTAPGVLQMDLLPTILDCMDADSDPIGYSLLKLDENAKRERLVRFFSNRNDFPACPKIATYGFSIFNSYTEYRFTGVTGDENNYVCNGTYPITDYWW